MEPLSSEQIVGHIISLKRTDPRHIAGSGRTAGLDSAESPEQGFGKLFFQALNQVNDLQNRAMDLNQAMLTDPDSVNVHDVTIALAEANLSLSMTKSIMDRAIRAYREIISTR